MKRKTPNLGPGLLALTFALSCSQPEPDAFVFIQNATVIDGTGRDPQSGIDLLLRDSRIEAMGSDLTPPPGATMIDATGKFVLPGIIDTHVHLDAPVVFQAHARRARADRREHRPSFPLQRHYHRSQFVFRSRMDLVAADGAKRRPRRRASHLRHGSLLHSGGRLGEPARRGAEERGRGTRALEYVSKGTDGFKVVIEDGLGGSGTY